MAFFQNVQFVFSNLPTSKEKYSKKPFEKIKIIMLWAGILNFKFRIVSWNIGFWRLGGLKNELQFLKKTPLVPPLGHCEHLFKSCSTYCANAMYF